MAVSTATAPQAALRSQAPSRPRSTFAALGRLRAFNLLAAAAHLIQANLILALSTDFSLPVTSAFLKLDETTSSLVPDPATVVNLRIGPMVAVFSLLSAVAHFGVSVPGIHEWYVKNVRRGINPARWIEYSASSSVMILVIAMLVGIYDVVALIALVAVNASMILFGWTMELVNQTTRRVVWTPFWFGVFAGAIPWIAIAIALGGAGGPEGGPPGFVYGIFFSIFVVFNLFAVNMALQYGRVGAWRRYVFGERAYIVLSLAAKSALAWQVFAGTLRPV